MTQAQAGNDAYCSNCGYSLNGLTDSSKCPECGKPLVEVLTRPNFGPRGKRYQSEAKLFGWPVISIAFGPDGKEKRGHARGLIAVGDIATGGIAVGGIASGIVSVGGLAFGACALGGNAVGLLTAMGGLAISTGIATGGAAIGTFATGGGAAGLLAQGGGAAGLYARSAAGVSSASAAVFDRFAWIVGHWPPTNIGDFGCVLFPIFLSFFLAGIIGIVASMKLKKTPAPSTSSVKN